MFSDNDRTLLKETRDAARAAAVSAERARKGSFKRDQRLIKKVTGVAVDVRQIEQAVDELDAEDDAS